MSKLEILKEMIEKLYGEESKADNITEALMELLDGADRDIVIATVECNITTLFDSETTPTKTVDYGNLTVEEFAQAMFSRKVALKTSDDKMCFPVLVETPSAISGDIVSFYIIRLAGIAMQMCRCAISPSGQLKTSSLLTFKVE